jgi:DUF4097 and DUF4098 domain-containing protein YvlB
MSATLLVGMLAAALAQQTTVTSPNTDTTFSIGSGAVRVQIETFGGEIFVKTWDKRAIRVRAEHGRRDVVNIDSRGNSVRIEAEGRMGTPVNANFEITVPPSVAIEMSGVYTSMSVEGVTGDVDAETVQGSIKVVGGGRLKLESVEGDIIIEKARGRVSANTVNRGIRITDVTGDIEAETVNGPIILRGIESSHIDLATVNGRIVYDGTIKEKGDYALTSHNGQIWVVIPERAGVTVGVSTFNGDLNASFPIQVRDASSKRRYNFVIGNGSARLDVESFGGDINLRRPGETLPSVESLGKPKPPKPPKVRINEHDREEN